MYLLHITFDHKFISQVKPYVLITWNFTEDYGQNVTPDVS
jgi:hypothetical protein